MKAKLSEEVLDKIKDNIYKYLYRIGKKARSELIKSMENTVRINGKVNPTKNSPGPPSAPFNPPAIQTGRLKNSIHSRVYYENTHTIVLELRVDTIAAPYAIFLEFGTSKMLPRPYFLPIVNQMKEWFTTEVKGVNLLAIDGVTFSHNLGELAKFY